MVRLCRACCHGQWKTVSSSQASHRSSALGVHSSAEYPSLASGKKDGRPLDLTCCSTRGILPRVFFCFFCPRLDVCRLQPGGKTMSLIQSLLRCVIFASSSQSRASTSFGDLRGTAMASVVRCWSLEILGAKPQLALIAKCCCRPSQQSLSCWWRLARCCFSGSTTFWTTSASDAAQKFLTLQKLLLLPHVPTARSSRGTDPGPTPRSAELGSSNVPRDRLSELHHLRA